jgi:hypothetical protein
VVKLILIRIPDNLIDICLLQKMLRFYYVEDRTLKRHISIGVFVVSTLTPEVQCRLVYRNHVIWRTKITKCLRNENDSKQPYYYFFFKLLFNFFRLISSFSIHCKFIWTILRCISAFTSVFRLMTVYFGFSRSRILTHDNQC